MKTIIRVLIGVLLLTIAAGAQTPPNYTYDPDGIRAIRTAGAQIFSGQILKLDSSTGRMIPVTTSDTSGAVGIAVFGAASGAFVNYAVTGDYFISVDNSCTIGQSVIISAIATGNGHCTSSPSGQVIGIALQSASFSVKVQVTPMASAGSAGTSNGVTTTGSPVSGQWPFFSGPNSISGSVNATLDASGNAVANSFTSGGANGGIFACGTGTAPSLAGNAFGFFCDTSATSAWFLKWNGATPSAAGLFGFGAPSSTVSQINPTTVSAPLALSSSALSINGITGIQGNGANLLGAGTVSGTSVYLCTDAGGNATTSGCPAIAGSGGTNIQTGSYGPTSGDNGKTVIMNCSSACNLTLPNPQPSTTWRIGVVSIGSTVPTVVLNSMTFNGASNIPVLNNFRFFELWADSATSSNYYGTATLSAGVGVSLTPTSNAFTVAENPFDASQVFYREEFGTGNISTGVIGELGWAFATIGSAPVLSVPSGVWPNLGLIQLATNATPTALQGGSLGLIQGVGTGNLNANTNWRQDFIATYSAITDSAYRLGFSSTNNAYIPTLGIYSRFDTALKNLASAVCNDAGNKCGLTTLTCATSDTVTFTVTGGTATGSVSCTGTNAIANGTAITVVSAGAGYNSTGLPTVGVVTGGTSAVHTGSIAITPTLGAVGTGADTDFMLCATPVNSVEACKDTGTAPSAGVFFRQKLYSTVAGTVHLQMYNGSGAAVGNDVCLNSGGTGGCGVSAIPTGALYLGYAEVAAQTTVQHNIQLDFFALQFTGLAR